MRDFLRGGYKTLTEPTVISNHGRPVFTVFPHIPTAPRGADLGSNGHGEASKGPGEEEPGLHPVQALAQGRKRR